MRSSTITPPSSYVPAARHLSRATDPRSSRRPSAILQRLLVRGSPGFASRCRSGQSKSGMANLSTRSGHGSARPYNLRSCMCRSLIAATSSWRSNGHASTACVSTSTSTLCPAHKTVLGSDCRLPRVLIFGRVEPLGSPRQGRLHGGCVTSVSPAVHRSAQRSRSQA